MAKRQPSLTDLLPVAARTAHVWTAVFFLAASGPLLPGLHALLAHAEHAIQTPGTHGVTATRLPLPDLLPAHAVVLVTELTPLTHSVTVTQTL